MAALVAVVGADVQDPDRLSQGIVALAAFSAAAAVVAAALRRPRPPAGGRSAPAAVPGQAVGVSR